MTQQSHYWVYISENHKLKRHMYLIYLLFLTKHFMNN